MEPASRWHYGKFPEYGAIFMSNTKTKQECFARSLFALPLNFTEFVRKVRAGMVLFLFDYQVRKLYGVFEAVSDGGLNIVPHAYNSSGKSFPAQVQFRITWECCPLCEHEFRHVIRDNYFTKHKFNFGLSEDQVRRLLYLFDSRRVDVKKSPSEAKIKDSNSEHSGIKRIKRRHSDDSDNQKSSVEPHKLRAQNLDFTFLSKPDLPENAENFALSINTSSEVESCLIDPSSPKSLKDIKSVNTSPSEPFELGDFIPLVSLSPEHCNNPNEIMATNDHGSSGLYRDQNSPSCSKDVDFPEHHLRLKGLNSDRTNETKSVFSRLEEREKCDSVNRGNLLHRRNIQSGIYKIPQRRQKVGNVFSRLNFNSENNKQEKDVSKEKEKRRGRDYGRAEKNYLTTLPVMFDNGGKNADNNTHIPFWRGMQEEQPFMNAKPEDKTDRVIEDKRYHHSSVISFLSDMPQQKTNLTFPIPRAESENVNVRESYLDDHVEVCENSTVETKPKNPQPTLSNIPFKVDAMQYHEHISEHNQMHH